MEGSFAIAGSVGPNIIPALLFTGGGYDICCGEGQTEGATWSATLQQGLIQRSEHVDHGVGIAVGVSYSVFSGPPTHTGATFCPQGVRVRVWVRIWGY